MNHETAEPGTDRIETQAAHSATEFDHDHDCEYCSPEPVAMPNSVRQLEPSTRHPLAIALTDPITQKGT
jgi:hypothetical protein